MSSHGSLASKKLLFVASAEEDHHNAGDAGNPPNREGKSLWWVDLDLFDNDSSLVAYNLMHSTLFN
jgi:hypothetical protein